MATPILWTIISVEPFFNYIYLDIYTADSRINRISYSGEIRREKLGGTVYSSSPTGDINLIYNHLPTTLCTCGFQDKQEQITQPTLIKPKSRICTCNVVDGTMRIDNILQEGSHLRNTLSVLLTFRKKNEEQTDVILDLSETCETQGHCITVSTTKESGLKTTTENGFAVAIATYLNNDHEEDNGFEGAEYTYPITKTITGNYAVDEDFERLLFNGIENLGWNAPNPGLLYATQDTTTTQNTKYGGMRI